MSKKQKPYATVMNDAAEHVFIYALRHSMDTRVLGVEFDVGRGPGPHSQHTRWRSADTRASSITSNFKFWKVRTARRKKTG
jgi:hypothetical protein